MKPASVALCLVALLLLPAAEASAYIDPATGSYVLQVVIAGFLGALLSIKMFWRQIVSFFRERLSRRGSTGEDRG